MQLDFHYYATYCAAVLAGYTHEDSLEIAYSAQFVDCCSRTLLDKIGGPLSAATTQLSLEMMEAETTTAGLQDITRIWASFHFLPGNLHVEKEKCSKRYLDKYRMICNTNGELLADTVELARGKDTTAAGLAMHVLADTWAHRYFAGTPSLVINNTGSYFFELVPGENGIEEVQIKFNHNPATPDDPDKFIYTNSVYQGDENAIMNLGHGRCGHFPDYSFARYRYMPAWYGYREVIKNNPDDYMHAFCQMVYALKSLREKDGRFQLERYAVADVKPWEDTIKHILRIRQINACAEWKALGEEMSGRVIPDFDIEKYQQEYIDAPEGKHYETFLGRFILAALAQKSMVTNRIFNSGNMLAGYSIDYQKKGFMGIKDFHRLEKEKQAERRPEQ